MSRETAADWEERTRELEEEVARLRAELARAQAPHAPDCPSEGSPEDPGSELRALTRTLSHDLRTPLIAIAGFCSLLRRRLAEHPDAKVFEYLDRLRDANDWVQALLNDLVELLRSRDLTPHKAPVDLEALTEKVLSVAEGLPDGRGVCIQRTSSFPVVMGDEHQLRRVLENLTQNALRCLKNVKNPVVGIGAEADDREVTISVSDNGPGIDPADQERIFEPFVRLSSSEEGSGLGLAIARRIVQAHGGRIWVESQGDGGGSVFRFTLPAREPPGLDAGA